MKNLWVTFFSGRVLVKVKGKGLERFINQLTRSGLSLWKVRWVKEDGILFYISLSDLHKLRHNARKFDCNVTFIRGEGFPFLWKRMSKHGGFLFGVVVFFMVVLILSNITWGIHIQGANPETEHRIRMELDKLGIRVGALHFFSDRPEIIQRKLTDSIDNITWIGVELKGTTFHFQVVQRTEPEKPELLSPRHLVAKKKAVIADLFVEKGIPLVKVNQYVVKGQMLVSGEIGSGDEPVIIPAQGEIWGKTWYNTNVEFPLESTFQVYNGEEKRVHSFKIGKLTIPFWGFGKIKYQSYETELDDRRIHFLWWQLPISYSEKTIREKEEIQRVLTKAEAVEAAKELARRDLRKNIPEGARVDEEYILHEEVQNGKLKLSVNFQVIENIAEEKSIIQGD